MPQPIIGCDLSRAFLDLCRLPSGTTQRVANTPDAIATWVDTLERDVLVVFEATSGCDGNLIAFFISAMIIVSAPGGISSAWRAPP